MDDGVTMPKFFKEGKQPLTGRRQWKSGVSSEFQLPVVDYEIEAELDDASKHGHGSRPNSK
jgi:hypothetical protein